MSDNKDYQLKTVVEQELALKVYIDSLLIEPAPEVDIPAPEPELPIQAPVVEVAEPVAVKEDIVDTPATVPEAEAASNLPFDCLMFKVAGGLQLSVPLASLNGILPWQGDCTPLPGHEDWFLGLVSNRGQQVRVIDIASFVIPENHQARASLAGERNFKHLILIDEGRYGIVCDELGDMLKLNHDEVRWRENRSSRPWLAGTVIDRMCALIDVEQFVNKLKEGIKLDDI